MISQEDKVKQFAKEHGIFRSQMIESIGINRMTLKRLVDQEKLLRICRGLYMMPDANISEYYDMIKVARLVPRGVICLLSALRFYEMTTENPFEIWLAHEYGTTPPRIKTPPIRSVRFSRSSFSFGIQNHTIDKVKVLITSPAKTVADCFKFRNKIGIDVAIAALKDYRQNRLGTLDELWEAAKVCRVKKVIFPYMEAII